jgi:hypothetical protein
METITTQRGRVIGIGELKVFPSQSLPYEIPLLSFIVVKQSGGAEKTRAKFTYVSTCIQIRIDGYGETPQKAMENMLEKCGDYLKTNFTNEQCKQYGWSNLHELFHFDEYSVELQNAYNDMCLNLAERGIATDITSALIAEKIELEKQIAELKTIQNKTRNGENDISVSILQYQEAA